MIEILDMINDKTLNMVLVITYLVIIMALMMIYPVYKKKYFITLIIGYLLIGIALVLILMRPYLPVFWNVIIGNLMVFSGSCILMIGYQEMINSKCDRRPYVALIAIFLTIHVYFTYFNPILSMRIINYSCFIILGYMNQIIVYLKVISKKFDVIQSLLTFSFAIHVFTALIRINSAIGNESIVTLFRGAVVFKVFMFGSIVAALTQIISVMLYNTRDLIK